MAAWRILPCGLPVTLLAAVLTSCAGDGEIDRAAWTAAHASLEAAERAFASRSLDAGMRDAFLAYLASDGVLFQPGPVSGREFWEARPEVEGTLWWTPRVVEVARSGDLGYTTGPFRFTAGDLRGFGWYASMWRRDPGSEWRVALDLGTRTTAPAGADTAGHPVMHVPWDGIAAAALDSTDPMLADVLAVDDAFSDSASTSPDRAYRSYASGRLRVHRDLRPPLTQPDTVAAWWRALPPAGTVERLGSGIAASGDLAYTYGTARGAGADGGTGWLRVWRREARGGWRLVLDVAVPMPPAG